MQDLISRQAAIDALNVGVELLNRVLDDADIVGAERAKYEWGLGLIESYIYDMKELPSAQQWTPCSERLPEYDGEMYLVSESRYIDAEILSDALRHLTLGETDVARATMKITHYVSRMPTADVVEVVRCRDCKFYTFKPQQTSRVTSVRRCNRSAIVCTKPDDYCSFGEKAKE